METITGHVKLAGRANKNNYRARGLSHHRNAWFELFMDSSFAVPRFIILPPLLLRVVCGENGKERVGEWKKGVEKGGRRKNEGKERRLIIILSPDTPVASRNRATLVEMTTLSIPLFQPFSISSPFDMQSSPLSLRSGHTTVPNRFASLDRRRRSRVDGATFRVFTRRKCPLTSPYPYIHDGSVSKVSIKGLIHASHKFRPESRIDLSLFVAPFLALEY